MQMQKFVTWFGPLNIIYDSGVTKGQLRRRLCGEKQLHRRCFTLWLTMTKVSVAKIDERAKSSRSQQTFVFLPPCGGGISYSIAQHFTFPLSPKTGRRTLLSRFLVTPSIPGADLQNILRFIIRLS